MFLSIRLLLSISFVDIIYNYKFVYINKRLRSESDAGSDDGLFHDAFMTMVFPMTSFTDDGLFDDKFFQRVFPMMAKPP